MKKFTLKNILGLISFLGLINLSGPFALALSPSPTQLTQELPMAQKIKIKIVKEIKQVGEGAEARMQVKLFGTAFFPNKCYVPDSFVKEIVSLENDSISFNVLGVQESSKVCFEIYQPVEKKFLIHSFEVPASIPSLPDIEVNGLKID